jgi:serine/threonine protein kinase
MEENSLKALNELQYMHISEIVHKNINPNNILLISDKELEGAIRLTFEPNTETLPYKAPEQLRGGTCTTV